MDATHLQQLKARLAEIEREKAALRTHIKTLSSLPAGFPIAAPPPSGPRLRAPAVPEEWLEMHPDRVASLPRGTEVLTRAGVTVATSTPPGAPAPEDSAEFAPPPDGVSIKQSVAPDHIHRSSFLRPGLPSAMAAPLAEPPHDRLRTYLGASAFNRPKDPRRRRLNPAPATGSSRAKAIFLVIMVIILGFLAVRAFT